MLVFIASIGFESTSCELVTAAEWIIISGFNDFNFSFMSSLVISKSLLESPLIFESNFCNSLLNKPFCPVITILP